MQYINKEDSLDLTLSGGRVLEMNELLPLIDLPYSQGVQKCFCEWSMWLHCGVGPHGPHEPPFSPDFQTALT